MINVWLADKRIVFISLGKDIFMKNTETVIVLGDNLESWFVFLTGGIHCGNVKDFASGIG